MARALLIAEKPSLMKEVQAVYKTMNYPDQIDFKCFRGHTMTLYAPADYTKDWEKTLAITAYAETKEQSKLIDQFIRESDQKFKRIIQVQ